MEDVEHAAFNPSVVNQAEELLRDNEGNKISKSLACPPVLDSISGGASPASLVSLGRTCRALRSAMQSFNRAAFNIDTYLRQLGLEPIPFRSMQQRTFSLIGGSTALCFFTRTQVPHQNINLFVQPGHAYEVARHIIDVQGFSYRPPGSRRARDFIDGISDATAQPLKRRQRRDSIHTYHAIDCVHRFEKRISRTRVVELLVMQTLRSAVHAILNGHSISLYPLSTFRVGENQELKWNMIDNPVDAYLGIVKYAGLGFEPRAYSTKEYARATLHTGVKRRIGDEFCWTIRFNTDELHYRPPPTATSPAISSSLQSNNSWQLIDGNEAADIRSFFDKQWSHELEARHINGMHQTWWDGELERIQTGHAQHVRYTTNNESHAAEDRRMYKNHSWCGDSDKAETASTITERSYFSIIPVLINARMTRKSTDEILRHFKTALERDDEEAEPTLSDEEFDRP
ncbi:hypothetical protein HWV62_2107 [Athelia sp. TMB]|nr:hypothetical protein HWV62_2107 [Athelia sp. TMB]